jgi:hypothetical protein
MDCKFAYFIFTIYFTQSTVVERQQAQSSWYQTSFVVWEVRKGEFTGKIVSLHPLFLCWALSPFRKIWESEKAFCLFRKNLIGFSCWHRLLFCVSSRSQIGSPTKCANFFLLDKACKPHANFTQTSRKFHTNITQTSHKHNKYFNFTQNSRKLQLNSFTMSFLL